MLIDISINKSNFNLRRHKSFQILIFAILVVGICYSQELEQPTYAKSYNIAKMTDFGRLPEDIYKLVMYGPLDFDTSSRLVQLCEPLSQYSWRMNFKSDPLANTQPECKAFRYPIVILLRQPVEINGVPCSGGLVAFHHSESLAYCLVSAEVDMGGDLLEPGEPISFDPDGVYRYPSESRRVTISLESAPNECKNVTVTNAAQGGTYSSPG